MSEFTSKQYLEMAKHYADAAEVLSGVAGLSGPVKILSDALTQAAEMAKKFEQTEPVVYRFTENMGNGKTEFSYYSPEELTLAYRDNCLAITPLYAAPQPAIPEGMKLVPVGPDAMESGWLVEWSGVLGETVIGTVSWLCLSPKCGGFGALEFGFTKDSTKALRLCRKEDAEAVLKLHLGGHLKPDWYTKPYSVTEHIWSGKPVLGEVK